MVDGWKEPHVVDMDSSIYTSRGPEKVIPSGAAFRFRSADVNGDRNHYQISRARASNSFSPDDIAEVM